MAGMALEKTWVVSEYTADLGTSALNCAMALFQVKEAMKAHGWTVSTSSDGVAGGSVTGDNWIDAGDVVWAASSNHSWIVMTNAAISANFAICIDCLYAEKTSISVYCTSAGYNGDGTKSSRPTAVSNEVTLRAGAYCTSVTTPMSFMCFTSTDYQCTRICLLYGTYTCLWIFDVPKQPPSWWTTPYVAFVQASSKILDMTTLSSATDMGVRGRLSATTFNISFGGVGGASGLIGSLYFGYGCSYAGGFPLCNVSLISLSSAVPGFLGYLYDMYWTSIAFAVTYPKPIGYLPSAASTKGFIMLGQLAVGNDGNVHGGNF